MQWRKATGWMIGLWIVGNVMTVNAATTGTTNAIIDFVDLEPPEILDPEDPDIVLDPQPNEGDGDVNETAGDLTLDFVPHLYFGSNEIENDLAARYEAVLPAKGGSLSKGPFLQVTDRRIIPGQWTVSVQASAFESSGTATLTGAYLTFSNGVVDSPTTNSGFDGPDLRGTDIRVDAGGGAVPLLSADTGKAPFTWIAHWIGPENVGVFLDIPINTKQVGEHTSVLTWTLSPDLGP